MRCHRPFAHRRARSLPHRIPHPERGAVVVETAFALPVFLLLFVGLTDLGLGALQTSQASSAAVDAARAGVVMSSPPNNANCAADAQYQKVIAAAQTRIPGRTLGCEHVVITCLQPGGTEVNCATADTLNDRMKVTVRWRWDAFSPAGQMVPIDEIVGTSTMRFIPQPLAPPTATTFPVP